LEVKVEPKRGDTFISSVEGVLNRVEGVVKMLAREVEGTVKKRAETVLDQIDKIKAGKASMTLIIDDHTGNSAVIPNKVFFNKDSFTKAIQI
jgi:zinc finger protein